MISVVSLEKSFFKFHINSFCAIILLLMIGYSTPLLAQEDDTVAFDLTKYKVYNSLSSAILNPDSVFVLDLSKKKLATIPSEVYQFKNLLSLKISRNKFKVLPDSIGNLISLVELDASTNDLKAIPVSIGKLTNLRKLSLNKNVIESLPVEIGQLVNLEYIEMWDNELDTIPDEIKNLRKLKVFELRGILFEKEEMDYWQSLLPETKFYFSPPCNCATKF